MPVRFSRIRCFSQVSQVSLGLEPQRNRANTVGQFANYEILRGRAWAPAITETRPTAGTLAESGEYCVDAPGAGTWPTPCGSLRTVHVRRALARRNTLYHANHGHTSSMSISCVATLHEVSAPGFWLTSFRGYPRGPPARRYGPSLTSWIIPARNPNSFL